MQSTAGKKSPSHRQNASLFGRFQDHAVQNSASQIRFSKSGELFMQEQLPKLDPSKWVSEHGETLYAYALSRLKNADSAEDAVQESLLGALRNISLFPPQGDIGPWLMGILKKKVVDRQRRGARASSDGTDPSLDKLFDEKGNWSDAARAADPLRLDSLEQAEFMEIFRRCLKGLPQNQAAVFVGREINEQTSDDLCKKLGVSSTNLWVLMHRARLRLAECIRARWVMGDA